MRKIDTLDRKKLITIGKKLKIGNYIGNYSKPYLRKEDLKNMIIKALEKKSTSNSNLVTHVNKSDFKQNLSKKSCNRIQNKETNYFYAKLHKENHPSYGKKWFNNGIKNVLAYDCPEEFKPGLLRKKNKK